MYLRFSILTVCCWCAFSNVSFGQFGNDRPDIIGQEALNTPEDQPITIELNDLIVVDRDDIYPDDFTLIIIEDEGYIVEGTTVTPPQNFNGNLRVRVMVNDGHVNSRRYSIYIDVTAVNDPPVITGQAALNINEDESLTLQPLHLSVVDPDDNYPNGFTIIPSPGTNYTVSGNTIIPARDFAGVLSASVKVNDGESDSAPFDLQISINQLNDPPSITGQIPLQTMINKPLTILPQYITVADPDNTYPDDFVITIAPGANYTVTGNTVTPSPDFEGTLQAGITVHDGIQSSAPFNLTVRVTNEPIDGIPHIIGQRILLVNEDESITLELVHLELMGVDNTENSNLVLIVLNGENYSFSGNLVTPAPDFNGDLSVTVAIRNGRKTGPPYNMSMTVLPVNDPPFVEVEEEILTYEVGNGPAFFSEEINVTDVDSDSISLAEIGFEKENYRSGNDILIFSPTKKITGAFDEESGVLVLAGRASVADYKEAVRSVQYNYTSTKKTIYETKAIYISMSDGESLSPPTERNIKLVPIPLEIPTGFTPNDDRANDTWKVKPVSNMEEFSESIIKVYNKKGVVVYQATGLDSEWDGKFNGEILPVDTYYYTIDLNLSNVQATYRGWVTILR